MVKKRGEVYYLRLYVPKAVQNAVGCKEIVKSLGTGRAKEARTIASCIKVTAQKIWKQVIMMERTLSNSQIKELIDHWLEQELMKYSDPCFAPREITRYPPDRIEGFIEELTDQKLRFSYLAQSPDCGYIATDENLIQGGPSDGMELGFCEGVISDLLATQGKKQIDDESHYYLVRQVAIAMTKVIDAKCDAALNIVPERSPAENLSAAQSTHTQSLPSTVQTIPLLSEALKLRLDEVKQKRTKTTVTKFEGQIPMLLKVLGDKPVNQYRRANFIEAQGLLKKWPRNANIQAPNASVASVLKRTDLGDPLAESTVFSYLILMATVFNFCVESDWLTKSPVPKWDKPVKKNIDKINIFSNDQLKTLFRSNHYTRASVRVREPHNYWVPLIGLFSGLRIDEICQLYERDIIEEEGVLCFHAKEADDQKTKSHRSRYVPVHSQLIKLGLIEYVDNVRSNKNARLFPQLELGGRGYSTNFGKNINKYIQRHVTNGLPTKNRPTFHSLRKNFAHAITAKGIPRDILATLLGHAAPQKVTVEDYAGQYPPKVLKEAIESIHFSCVDSMLK